MVRPVGNITGQQVTYGDARGIDRIVNGNGEVRGGGNIGRVKLRRPAHKNKRLVNPCPLSTTIEKDNRSYDQDPCQTQDQIMFLHKIIITQLISKKNMREQSRVMMR
jgi:hypothetical protein